MGKDSRALKTWTSNDGLLQGTGKGHLSYSLK